jgi:CRP-like cAMP-binding protein
MISPELLRRYTFFSSLDDSQLVSLAMLAEEVTFGRDEKIFERGEPAEALYFLIDGSVGLYDSGEEREQTILTRGIPVGEINPGEPFSISALIEPQILTSSAWSSTQSRALRFEAVELRKLFEKDQRLENSMTQKAAAAALDRLQSTRIQLAAAWA